MIEGMHFYWPFHFFLNFDKSIIFAIGIWNYWINLAGNFVDQASTICHKEDNKLLMSALESGLKNHSWSQIVVLQEESNKNGISGYLYIILNI